jgi:hypothetical protein
LDEWENGVSILLFFNWDKKKNPQSYFLDVNMKLSTLSLILLKKTEKVLIFIYMKEK